MGLDDFRISRRALLGAGGGLATLAALGAVSRMTGNAPAGERMPDPSGIRYVVTDKRYAQSLAFARVHVARGSQMLELTDGLTRMWRQSLEPLWRHRGGAVAGLTTRATWQALAEQARSHALRTRVLTVIDANDGHPDNLVSWIIA